MSAFSGEATTEFVRRYWSDDDDAPKHEKLCRAFAEAIANGFWAPGARLPTEAELTEAMPCSLGTVQRALRRLVEDGLIERRRGSGTIVADFNRAIEQPWHMRFFDDESGSNKPLTVYTKALKREITASEGPWSDVLNQNGQEVVRIDRIFAINGDLKVYSIVYALAAKFPTLTSMPLSGLDGANFKLLMARRHVMPVHKVRQSMRMEVPGRDLVKASDLLAGQPATIVNFIAYSLTGEVLYYQDFYIPPSRYRLDLGTVWNAGT